MGRRNSTLAKNTIALYILNFSSQFINLFLIPFETRVLGPSVYGMVALGVSLSLIVSVVMDFGFLLSATEEVVKHRDDRVRLSRILTDATAAKAIIGVLIWIIVLVVVEIAVPFSQNKTLFLLYCFAYVLNGLLPDFVYRGIEDMKSITVRTVLVRIGSMLPLFAILRGPDDVCLIPMMIGLGNFVAVLVSLVHLSKKYQIVLTMPSLESSIRMLRNSAPFFVSRFASTFYQSLNSIILGSLYPGQAVVGQYGAADKLLSLSKTFSSPIADSLYPYMIRTKNYQICLKLLALVMPFIMVACGMLFVFAEPICLFVFGEGYADAAVLVRCLMPAIAVILPTYIVCFPILVPMGLSDYANKSNVIGAFVQLFLLSGLGVSGNLNAATLCVAVSISETSVFAYRLYAAVVYGGLFERSTGNAGG